MSSRNRNGKRKAPPSPSAASAAASFAPSLQAALEKALAANQSLQEVIYSQLDQVLRSKADNRRQREELLRKQQEKWRLCCSQSLQLALPPLLLERKWTRAFFAGPDRSSRPSDNEDTKRRRNMEKTTFFYHSQPPWSKAQSEQLWKLIKEVENNATALLDNDVAPTFLKSLDWSSISKRLSTEFNIQFTPDECRLHAHRLQLDRANVPFSKAESLKISEMVHSMTTRNGNASNDHSSSSSNNATDDTQWEPQQQDIKNEPDWLAIAQALHPRTPWECLVTYQTKLRPIQPHTWTLAQDEFLLRYVAAAGPQAVLDGTFIRDLQHMLPQVPKSHLLSRINASLLNVNMKHEGWSAQEERTLCLLMKVYSYGSSTVSSSSSSMSPLYLATTHFSNRSTKSVSDKWNRSLDPAYSSRPFTPQEDKKLLQIRQAFPEMGWMRLSLEHFPTRHGQRLAHRWTELVDQDQLCATTKLVKARKRQGTDAHAVLTEDDFVIQVKQGGDSRKKKRMM